MLCVYPTDIHIKVGLMGQENHDLDGKFTQIDVELP